MSSTFKNFLLLMAAVLALLGGYWLAQTLRPEPEITTARTYGGGEMINFTLPGLDGKIHSLEQWRGQVIVLNFWATWCPPCREEIPLLVALQKNRAATGLQVVSVAIDDPGAVARYSKSAGINYPVLLGGDDGLDLIARYGNRSGSLPFTVIIDRKGTIVVRKLGAFSRNEIEELVDPLIGPAKTENIRVSS